MLEFSDEVIANHIGVISGFAFASEYFSSENGTPLIRIRNLLQHKTETFYRASFDIDYMVNNGDILIGMDGDFNVVRWRGEPGLLNQRICKVSSKSELLSEGYLFHWFQPKIDEIHRRTPQTTVRHLSTKDIEHISIPFFPLNEQRRIAEILDTIDEAIQKTEALISKLKAMKQGLLHDLLTRGLDKNGKLRDPKAHPKQFKDSPLGRVPRRWDVRPLGVTATLQRGFDLPIQDRRPGDVPVFGSNGIDGWHNEGRVIGPGVITGRSGSIGFVYYTDTYFWPLNTTLYVKDFHSNRPKFIRLLLECLRLDRFVAATGVPSLNRNFVHPFEVTVPEPAEQDRIVDVVEAHDTRIRTEEQYRDKLKLQKKGLMHDLLTGKVRVRV